MTTLGGGCFWCMESVFKNVKGILQTETGYCGGSVPNPTYEAVCKGTTGHTEVVQLTFDTECVKFKEILSIFFKMIDPTQINAQGEDIGTSYRSVIFYHNDEQKNTAIEMIKELDKSGNYQKPIATTVEEVNMYFKAEDYHQDYFTNNPENAYCRVTIPKKIEKLSLNFKEYILK